MGGGYQSRPDGMDEFARRFADLQRQINDLRSAAGVRSVVLSPGGSIRSADFDGTDFAAPGTSGNYFGGDGLVANALKLRPGSVDNDALASPVAPGAVFASRTGFALTRSLTNILTTTITVPAGFTRAAVSVVARVFAYNPTANLDYLYGQANIAGFNGYALPLAVSGNNGSGTNISPFSTVLEGLTPGGSFTVQIAAGTSLANWPANTGNTCETSGSVMWFR